MAREKIGRVALKVLIGVTILGVVGAIVLRYVLPAETADRIWARLGAAPAIAERHIIPEGYSGWLTVTYGDPTAAPLPQAGDTLIVRYPRSGVVQTSDTLEHRWRLRSFHQVDADGMRRLATRGPDCRVWRRHTRRVFVDDRAETAGAELSFGFFVGTKEESEAGGNHPPGLPEIPELPERPDRSEAGE